MDDGKLGHLKDVLESLLASNETITARSVVSASEQFRHPSDITRSTARNILFVDYKCRQAALRDVAEKMDKNAKFELLSKLEETEHKLKEAGEQREILIIALKGIIRSVGKTFGLKGWQAMFSDYAEIQDKLNSMGIESNADIVSFSSNHTLD